MVHPYQSDYEDKVWGLSMLDTNIIKHLAGQHDQHRHGVHAAGGEVKPVPDINYGQFYKMSVDLDDKMQSTGAHLPHPVLTTADRLTGDLKKYVHHKAELSPFASKRVRLEELALNGQPVDWQAAHKVLSGLLEKDIVAYSSGDADTARKSLVEYLHELKTQAEENRAYTESLKAASNPGSPAALGMSDEDNIRHLSTHLNISRETLNKMNEHYQTKSKQPGLDRFSVGGMTQGFLKYLSTRIPTIARQIDHLTEQQAMDQASKTANEWPEPDLSTVKTAEDFKAAIKAWHPRFRAALKKSGEDPVTFSIYITASINEAFKKFKERTEKMG